MHTMEEECLQQQGYYFPQVCLEARQRNPDKGNVPMTAPRYVDLDTVSSSPKTTRPQWPAMADISREYNG